MASMEATSRAHSFDLLRLPIVGAFLKRPIGRRMVQTAALLIAFLMILDGFGGSQLAPRNLATVGTWIHFRGLLILALLVGGNFFCTACPFMLVRDVARKFFRPVLNWPVKLRNKWLSVSLLVAVLFAYELFDLWGSPAWTAWLIAGYFVSALVVDGIFKHASFCKYVCPIGQFNFTASALSPMEVRVREPGVCSSCKTVDCIKGTRHPSNESIVIQRGCELALFQPEKVGNMDCTFCMDCVYACPHDNIGIMTRLPASELWNDGLRSGVGRPSRRIDLSALAVVFAFAALLNAFGMVSPVYAVQDWLAGVMRVDFEWPALGAMFMLALIVEPVLVLGGAAFVTKLLTRGRQSVLQTAIRFAYALVPIGVGIWAAHYSFHVLTGFWTFLPPLHALAAPILGLSPLNLTNLPAGMSESVVFPIEVGLLSLGLIGSFIVAFQIASREHPTRARRACVPWAVVAVMMWGLALWLLSQPMEMRGSFLGA